MITKQDFIHEPFKNKNLTMHSKPAYLNSSVRFKNLLAFFKVVLWYLIRGNIFYKFAQLAIYVSVYIFS